MTALDLDVARWSARTDATDEAVLDRCHGPVLDVGCGPGRFVGALARRGVAALGVDAASRVAHTSRALGLTVLHRDVFTSLPGEGRWPTALLMDGNLGIGGDPAALLVRLRDLLAPGGRVIVEAHDDHSRHRFVQAQLVRDGRLLSHPFRWGEIGLHATLRYARATGFAPVEVWTRERRVFADLVRLSTDSTLSRVGAGRG